MDADEGLLKPPEAENETETASEMTSTSNSTVTQDISSNINSDTEEAQSSLAALKSLGESLDRSKTPVSHTNSLPGSQNLSPSSDKDQITAKKEAVFPKHQSFRIKRTKDIDGVHPGSGNSRWSFGGLAKSVGCGVTAFGSGVVQGTKAVGTGVVQGTKAVGTGVYEGTKAVGSGVVEGTKAVGTGAKVVGTGVIEGTKAVGTGVVEGTKVVASVSKDVTLAAGNKVSSSLVAMLPQLCS